MKQILGVSGDAGSFSEEAALMYAAQKNIHSSIAYLLDMEGVLSALEKENIDLGIFPVVNLLSGLVKPAFTAMGKHLFVPIDELWLNVQQCLLALPGTTTKQIKKIVSHPQALAQCTDYLQKTFKNIELIEWIDTAKAANDLAEGILPASTGVIASKRSAQVYGLETITTDIQNSNPNLTGFIIAKKHGGVST